MCTWTRFVPVADGVTAAKIECFSLWCRSRQKSQKQEGDRSHRQITRVVRSIQRRTFATILVRGRQKVIPVLCACNTVAWVQMLVVWLQWLFRDAQSPDYLRLAYSLSCKTRMRWRRGTQNSQVSAAASLEWALCSNNRARWLRLPLWSCCTSLCGEPYNFNTVTQHIQGKTSLHVFLWDLSSLRRTR